MNDENRTARAALTRLFEPGDIVGRALVAKHGAHAAFRIAIGARPAYPFWDVTAEELAEALSRWAPRIHDLDPEKDLAIIERLGGGFLVPGDVLTTFPTRPGACGTGATSRPAFRHRPGAPR